ncbi:hypothetical protein [Kutzneria sp. NPDC052558]|uniref:hypothetical protein n=1 Tax=Kutzneria sp. NPDC052558 TaxID=3364121 RepID=UPI0037C7DD96
MIGPKNFDDPGNLIAGGLRLLGDGHAHQRSRRRGFRFAGVHEIHGGATNTRSAR